MRTAKGATGLLFRSWPHDWQLHSTTGQDEERAAALDAPPLLVTPERPSQERQIEALNAALEAQRREEKEWWQQRRK